MAKIKKNKSKHKAFIDHLTLKSTNYIIFGIGIITIIIGYLIMASGDTNSFRSLSLAPIVLLIGYLIIIPLAIMYRKNENTKE